LLRFTNVPRGRPIKEPRLLRLPTAPVVEPQVRELVAVREIVHAFLTADRPEDVYQFALDRVAPLVGANFASVYLTDGASELMRLGAAWNWPEKYRPWLGELRVRLGFGPSGEAVSERRAIEVPDVFADPRLEDWQEVAQELGFRALVAMPLMAPRGVLGAVTFYFTEAAPLSNERRSLLRLVADQMAATAEKANLIDELRRTNAALQDANAELEKQYLQVLEARRLKDEFLANISHELRTPLTAVMGYLALLSEEISGPLNPDQRDDLSQVKHASDRLLELIDNLLELTQAKRGALPVHVEEFDVREPAEEVASAVGGRADGVVLRVDLPNFPMAMRSDRRKIAKVLAALLSNAYKFTEQGEVRLLVQVTPGWVHYEVHDTGIGIPEAARELVFDEFRQMDGSATRRYGGSGLGLALARRLARLLGGDIEVRSEVGAGSSFIMELPLDLDEPPDEPAPPSP
jgi:signal transduction histidine kinase